MAKQGDAMSNTELHYLELTELTRRIHAREISAVDATRAQLRRIEILDMCLRSYALATAELALEQADQADAEVRRGDIRGPLHGAPIAVKDFMLDEGYPDHSGHGDP